MQKTFLSLLFTLAITTGFSQTEKKTWMLGGSASYSSTQEGSIHNSILDISPRIGFFIMKNLSVGAALNINTTVDDGTNTSVFSFSPFARYYFLPLGKHAKLFGEAAGIFGNEDEGAGKSSLVGWSVKAGPAFFLNNHIAFETSVGYNSTKAGIETVKDNTIVVAVGLQIHIRRKS